MDKTMQTSLIQQPVAPANGGRGWTFRLAGARGIALMSAFVLACGLGVQTTASASDRAVGTLFGAGVGVVAGQSFGGRDGAVVGGIIGAVVGSQLAHNSHRSQHRSRDRGHSRGHRQPSVIFAPPIWSGHDSHVRHNRHWRGSNRANRGYRQGYREGRREARREIRREARRENRRWHTGNRW